LKWELNIQNWFNTLEPECKELSTGKLIMKYYEYKGIDGETTVHQYLVGLAEQTIPQYTTAYKIIKGLRHDKRTSTNKRNDSKRNPES